MKVNGDYYTGFETLKDCEVKILTDQVRKDTHKWYGDRIEALTNWARSLSEDQIVKGKDVNRAVFGCIANGHVYHFNKVNYASQLNSVKYQLEKARIRIMELECSRGEDCREAAEEEAEEYIEEESTNEAWAARLDVEE